MKHIKKYISYMQWLWVAITSELSSEQIKILLKAFTHKSYSMDSPSKDIAHQERLEFLWDAVLWWIIADLLYKNHKNQEESWLTLAKISLVREEYLADIARRIGLWKLLLLWIGEERSGGKNKNSVLSDGLEAIIAAIYILCGRNEAYNFVHKYIYISPADLKKPTKSRKNQLQEYCQKEFKMLPRYDDDVLEEEDNWNIVLFWSRVYIWSKLYGSWSWTNKRKAQESAAKNSLKIIRW